MSSVAKLQDAGLLALLRTEEDRLPLAAVEEILARMDRLEAPVAALLLDDASWQDEGPAWWAPIHAVRILAASGRASALDAVLEGLRRAAADRRDWLVLEASTILSALGIEVASKLAEAAARRSENPVVRAAALDALASHAVEGELPAEAVLALAASFVLKPESGPGRGHEIASAATFVLAYWVHRGREAAVLQAMGLDRRAARRDYRGIWELAKSGEVGHGNPFTGGSLLRWYDPQAVARRATLGPPCRSPYEQMERILQNPPGIAPDGPYPIRSGTKPGRNDPFPCGSGHFDVEVSLREIEPRIWRRFLIADTETFLDLHEAIQDAGGWTNSHLFDFRTPEGASVAGLPGDDGDEDPAPFAGDVPLRDLLAAAGPTALLYEYDFGDAWELDVRCHGLVRDAGSFQRRLTGGDRAFPAEDSGGVGGYEDCVQACAAKKPSADQKERLEWLGNWRPEAFDLAKTAKKFARAKRRRTGHYDEEM